MGGKLSRTKGHSFERWVAEALRYVFPNAKRQLEYQIDNCRGVDIANTGNYFFQCKRFRKPAPITLISEIQHDPDFGEVPVLVTRGDRGICYAVLPFAELVRLLGIEHGIK